jgi:hypothetical protein
MGSARTVFAFLSEPSPVAIAGKQKTLALASEHEENAAPFDGNHATEPNGEAAQLCKTAEPQ